MRPNLLDFPWSIYFSNAPEGEYGYYGRAFLEAARTQARSLARRQGTRNVNPLPALFLYRHSVELLAKAVILSGNRFMRGCGDGRDQAEIFQDFARARHRLRPLLAPIKAVFDFVQWEWYWPNSSVETFDDVHRTVAALERLDPDSFSFRYPTNLRGERAASPDHIVGVRSVFAALDDLAEALDTAVCGLDAEYSRL